MAELTPGKALAHDSLLEPLFSAAPPPPEAEHSTDELDKVGNLVTRGAYVEARQAAERLMREGLRDVRLVGPLLLGIFLERGPDSLHSLFSSIHELLTQRWGAFGPRAKKEVLADNGLRWLFKALNKHLEGHERLKDELWKEWCTPVHREPLLQALALSEPLLAALAATLPKGASVPPFRQLVSWIQTFTRALPLESPSPESQPPPSQQPAVITPQPPTRVTATPGSREEDAPPPQASRPDPATALSQDSPMLPVSPALELLMRKLQSFNTLVSEQDFLKASVVASDVLALLERFDPRTYLPTLFAPFFLHLSSNAQELEPLMRDTDSLSFRALQQLYQVDLDAFLRSRP